jgi:hypothetical protein
MSILTDQELENINDLVHGLRDRLAYLNDDDKKEFLNYLQTLYNAYPSPVKVVYGYDAIKTSHR